MTKRKWEQYTRAYRMNYFGFGTRNDVRIIHSYLHEYKYKDLVLKNWQQVASWGTVIIWWLVFIRTEGQKELMALKNWYLSPTQSLYVLKPQMSLIPPQGIWIIIGKAFKMQMNGHSPCLYNLYVMIWQIYLIISKKSYPYYQH